MIARLRALWQRLQPTLPVRAWNRYGDLRGDRLAGAASFYGFVSLFPLLLLAASVAFRVAGEQGVDTVQGLVDDNLPDLGINVARFYDNAGTVGVISGLLLLYSGLRWVDSIRAAVRSMWGIDDKPGNIVTRKLLDTVSLLGLGLLLALSWGASVVVRRMAANLLDWVGIEGAGASGLLEGLSWVLSVGVNTLLFAYLLAGLPRIMVPGREQALVALIGAVAFEILKTFLVEYVVGAGQAGSYGAFATPMIVIAWIYIVTRLLMVLAALTAESAIDDLEKGERARAEEAETGRSAADGAVSGASEAEEVAALLSGRQTRAVVVAAGAVMGAVGAGVFVVAGRAVRTLRAVVRPPRRGEVDSPVRSVVRSVQQRNADSTAPTPRRRWPGRPSAGG